MCFLLHMRPATVTSSYRNKVFWLDSNQIVCTVRVGWCWVLLAACSCRVACSLGCKLKVAAAAVQSAGVLWIIQAAGSVLQAGISILNALPSGCRPAGILPQLRTPPRYVGSVALGVLQWLLTTVVLVIGASPYRLDRFGRCLMSGMPCHFTGAMLHML